MIVGTTEAAHILKISTARLRVLLMAGRVQGAYKTGKMWLMPLFNGKPIIERGKRGPAPRWRNPRKPAKTIVHVNSHRIRQNQKQLTGWTESKHFPSQLQQPVITVKKPCNSGKQTNSFPDAGGQLSCQRDTPRVDPPRKGNINLYGHEVEILGGCRVVYRPNSPRCGAQVWIETLYDVKVTSLGAHSLAACKAATR